VFLEEPLDVCPSMGLEPSHRDLAALIQSLAGWLDSEGIQHGQTLAICKQNNLDIVLLACALATLGAVPALISSKNEPEVVKVMFERLQPDAIVADAAFRDQMGAFLDGRHCIDIDAEAVHRFRSRGFRAPEAVRASEEIAIITQTSGTTGVPKLVAHTGSSLYGQVRLQIPLGAMAVRRGELLAGCLPWFHVRSVVAYMAIALMGNPVLSISNPEPARVKDLLLRYRPRYLETYPNAFEGWEVLADDPAEPLSSVRLYLSTFDAAHPRTIKTLLNAAKTRFPIYAQIYGQSELGGVTFRLYSRRSIRRRLRRRNVGRRIWPYTKVRVVDPVTRQPLGFGEVGAIQARSVGQSLTYVGQDDLASSRRQESWWEMGDMGRMSRFGSLHLLDRAVDQIPGVESCLELEDELLDLMPCCAEAVIVPRPDASPVGVVSLKPGVPWEEAIWRSAAHQFGLMPEPLILAAEEIPRTATGKVRRKVLGEIVFGSQRPDQEQLL
jgi:acyl-coenzyme A synthetase/AMP-(fatty) acid ligase